MDIICGKCGYRNMNAEPGEFCGECGNELLIRPIQQPKKPEVIIENAPVTDVMNEKKAEPEKINSKEKVDSNTVKKGKNGSKSNNNNLNIILAAIGVIVLCIVFKYMQSSIASIDFLSDDGAMMILFCAVITIALFVGVTGLMVYDIYRSCKNNASELKPWKINYVWADVLVILGLLFNFEMLSDSLTVIDIAQKINSEDIWGVLGGGYNAYNNGITYYPNGRIVLLICFVVAAYLIYTSNISFVESKIKTSGINLDGIKNAGSGISAISESLPKSATKKNTSQIDMDTIMKLKQLVEMGVITEEEFKDKAREMAGIGKVDK